MLMKTTSLRQGRHREVGSEGSWRQTCEPRNTNVIEGRHLRGELAQDLPDAMRLTAEQIETQVQAERNA